VFFLNGVLFGVRIEQTHAASPSRQPLFTVVGIEVILTTTAYLALGSRAAMGAEIFVACVSLALGLQNAAFQRTGGGISVHTTYLTGKITSLITTEAELSHPLTRPGAKVNILYGIWLTFFWVPSSGPL
jgi:uncharacterized membrane protein YoaK (UPF0700 family)